MMEKVFCPNLVEYRNIFLMEDVRMDVFYMSTQSKLKDSSPIFSYVKK
jgi:hypothetical protein